MRRHPVNWPNALVRRAAVAGLAQIRVVPRSCAAIRIDLRVIWQPRGLGRHNKPPTRFPDRGRSALHGDDGDSASHAALREAAKRRMLWGFALSAAALQT